MKNLDNLSYMDLLSAVENQTLSAIFQGEKSLIIFKFQGGKNVLIGIDSTQHTPRIFLIDHDAPSLLQDLDEHRLSGKLKGWSCFKLVEDAHAIHFHFRSKSESTSQVFTWYGSMHTPYWVLTYQHQIMMHALDLHPPFKVRGEKPLAPLQVIKTNLSKLLIPMLMQSFQTRLDQAITLKKRRQEALAKDYATHQLHLIAKTIAEDVLSQQKIDLQYLTSHYQFAFPYDRHSTIGSLTSALFTMYKRAKQGLVQSENQAKLNQASLNELIRLREQTSQLNLESYQAIKVQLERLHLLHTSKDKQSKNAAFAPYRLSYKHLSLSFGKNKQQNHHLTFHLAKKSEIFLHIKDYPGSHIILHQATFDHDALIFAGQLALYLSKQTSGEVTYAKVGSLKAGQTVGAVIVKDAKHMKINANPSIDFASLLLTTTRY
jgi:predicted ribosome quality control (RQC) complex YloA/Tae2 family protein